jgi:hypothetical protein
VEKVAVYNGTECEAANNSIRNETCNTQPCPEDCVGDWGPWSECSVSCGGGNRTLWFVITSPALHGGADCVEANNTERSEACNEHHCPIDCIGEWEMHIFGVSKVLGC